MRMRERVEANAKPLVVFLTCLSGVGALAAFYIILVRVPAMASTKLEELFGTLQGIAVALLFVIMALLVNLTAMVYRATRSSIVPTFGDGHISSGHSGPPL